MMEKYKELCTHLQKMNLESRKGSFVSSPTIEYWPIQ